VTWDFAYLATLVDLLCQSQTECNAKQEVRQKVWLLRGFQPHFERKNLGCIWIEGKIEPLYSAPISFQHFKQSLAVSCIRRQTNQVVHSLTKVSRLHISPSYFDYMPPCKEDILLMKCNTFLFVKN